MRRIMLTAAAAVALFAGSAKADPPQTQWGVGTNSAGEPLLAAKSPEHGAILLVYCSGGMTLLLMRDLAIHDGFVAAVDATLTIEASIDGRDFTVEAVVTQQSGSGSNISFPTSPDFLGALS